MSLRPWLTVMACLACMAKAGIPSQPDDWPIASTKLSLTPADYKPIEEKNPINSLQPERFDPLTTRFHPRQVGFSVEGAEACVTMTIDGIRKSGDHKILLPEPFSLTCYEFSCASDVDWVFEIKKGDKRHALYSHIGQFAFSPDHSLMVLYNDVKDGHGTWQARRRIIDLATKETFELPHVDAACYIAEVSQNHVVTYGSPVRPQTGDTEKRRTVCIWRRNGILENTLLVPMNTTTANGEGSDDYLGLLPAEPATLYHLAYSGEDTCTLRLQGIRNAKDHREFRFKVSGLERDYSGLKGTAIQFDTGNLTLSGGRARYRISAGGRGDISNDWGPWTYIP